MGVLNFAGLKTLSTHKNGVKSSFVGIFLGLGVSFYNLSDLREFFKRVHEEGSWRGGSCKIFHIDNKEFFKNNQPKIAENKKSGASTPLLG